ncbi:MAG: hypothetical protein EKK52_18025 [Burkholderiales bacterium]|uniref:hypothetical protein n=1 Tax=Roseateles sp. TaxID=1971397 RepID=UPI000FA03571|nr:MAG: hypothetical protein EKK52_18025 [Burkholderiales bacterium]
MNSAPSSWIAMAALAPLVLAIAACAPTGMSPPLDRDQSIGVSRVAAASASSAAASGLSVELDTEYRTVSNSDPHVTRERLANVVEKYIRPKMSMTEAIATLNNAGFEINSDPMHVPPKPNTHPPYILAIRRLSATVAARANLVVKIIPQYEKNQEFVESFDIRFEISTL